jgi:hypothetical protein
MNNNKYCKEQTLTLGSKLAVVEGGGVDGDEVADD